MTTAEPPPPAAEEATILSFRIGRPYPTTYVAAFFMRSKQWAVDCCNDGRFPNAFKPPGSNHWLIPGEDVRAMYGEERIRLAQLAAAKEVPTVAQERRKAEADLKRIEETRKKAKATR